MKRGRPRKTIVATQVERIRHLAGRGLSEEQIARSLGMSPSTFLARKKEDQSLDDVIGEGRASAVYDVANSLYENALSGNVTAAIFWLKNNAGWRDKNDVEVAVAPAPRPLVTI